MWKTVYLKKSVAIHFVSQPVCDKNFGKGKELWDGLKWMTQRADDLWTLSGFPWEHD